MMDAAGLVFLWFSLDDFIAVLSQFRCTESHPLWTSHTFTLTLAITQLTQFSNHLIFLCILKWDISSWSSHMSLTFIMFLFNFHQIYDIAWIHFIYIWVSRADSLVDTCACVWLFQFDLCFHSKIFNQSTSLLL